MQKHRNQLNMTFVEWVSFISGLIPTVMQAYDDKILTLFLRQNRAK